MHSTAELPAPPASLAALSSRLSELIGERIRAAGGWLDFSEFMRAALYEPGLGYYSAGSAKLGPDGDFTTAPEISPLFPRCLARAIAPALAQAGPEAGIVELGPGTGRLALELLPALARLDRLPAFYGLLEISADLRERQRALLSRLDEPLRRRVRWLDVPPDRSWSGVLLANEVVDALPVSRFVWHGDRPAALGVALDGGRLGWSEAPASRTFAKAVQAELGERRAALPAGYRSELCPSLRPWLREVSACLRRGLLLFADYGLTRRDYYAPHRSDGTLVCHYRHRVHADPFWCPGAQDISAWVNFSALADAGRAEGLELAGFGTQASFLAANGLAPEAEALQEAAATPAQRIAVAQGLRRLLLPGDMGEYFKVLALGRAMSLSLELERDLSQRL